MKRIAYNLGAIVLLVAVLFAMTACKVQDEHRTGDYTAPEQDAGASSPELSGDDVQEQLRAEADDPRKFLYTYEEVRFERFSGFNKVKDAKMLEYANEILNGVLYVSAQIEGMPYESIAEIDWNVSFSKTPNSYLLYLQGLTPLEPLGNAYRLTADEKYLKHGVELIQSWVDYIADSEKSAGNPMAWNDHGAAIRAESLLYFMLISQGTGIDTPQFRELIYEQLEEHAKFLASETHYTENHNHGIFQDQALLHIGYFIESPDTEQWIETAENRLVEQKKFAFNSEMVHVENSTGYSDGIISLFSEIANFLEKMGNPLYQELTSDTYDAAEFLAWAWMPNGIISSIGDTNSTTDLRRQSEIDENFGNPRLEFARSLGKLDYLSENQKQVLTKYYPDAGYFFYRENWDSEVCTEATWKMFKAGYSTRTHKHADDTAFMLYSKGYEIFTDPGYYNYMSGTPYRSYFISSSAHNVVTVDEKSYSPTVENAGKTGMLAYNGTDVLDHVLAFNDMYFGVEMDRHFYSSGDLTILYDNIISEDVHTYSQLLHLAENIDVVTQSGEETVLAIADTGYFVRIQQFVPTQLEVVSGKTDEQPMYGHISRGLNHVTDTVTLCYLQAGCNVDYITVITIEDQNGQVRLKDGTQIHYSEILYDSEKKVLNFGEQTITLSERQRPSIEVEVTAGKDAQLKVTSILPETGMRYAWYVIDITSAKVLHKTDFSDSAEFLYDLSGLTADLLIKGYVMSTEYPQRKSEVIGALIYDSVSEEYRVDEQEKYPYLNLEHYGHHTEKVSDNIYRFCIDYCYSWTTTQRWYIYRNGAYYTVLQTRDQPILEYEFTEPGEYTVSYYLRTANGDYEFWDFDIISIP